MQNFEPIFSNDGYRPNVGIVICNKEGQVFWAHRVNNDGWQFPQGGVSKNESLVDAMYRELHEETGLKQKHVRIVAHTQHWLKYDLPKKFLRNQNRKFHGAGRRRVNFKGQKQVWFLLELLGEESVVNLKCGLEVPEFDRWRWVDASYAINNIVDFKRSVYKKALSEFKPFLSQ